jgi:hypothetical protein
MAWCFLRLICDVVGEARRVPRKALSHSLHKFVQGWLFSEQRTSWSASSDGSRDWSGGVLLSAAREVIFRPLAIDSRLRPSRRSRRPGSASRLLLCEAVDGAKPPDERAAVDANHLPCGHDAAQDSERFSVASAVAEGWHQQGAVHE